jgi:hypothetical protein
MADQPENTGVSTTLPEKPMEGSSWVGPGVSGTSYGYAGVSGTSLAVPARPATATSAGGPPGNPATDGVYGTGTNGVHGVSSDTGTIGRNTGAGVLGENMGAGTGVAGTSSSGYGVAGTSTTSTGVHGVNGTGSGVTPQFGCGVFGESENGYGVYGASKNASGVYGTSGSGHLAGEFAGDVSITGNLSTTGTITAKALTLTGGFQGTTATFSGALTGTTATFSGAVQASDVVLTGADCAEEFDVAEATRLEPGTVVVFNDEAALVACTEAYSKRAAGVISGAGDYRPGVILDRRPSGRGRAAVALVGKVYCKVDADVAPILVGDLLTTSALGGHAMKAVDPTLAFGAVIGKALASLQRGRGLIPILVALQ